MSLNLKQNSIDVLVVEEIEKMVEQNWMVEEINRLPKYKS